MFVNNVVLFNDFIISEFFLRLKLSGIIVAFNTGKKLIDIGIFFPFGD